MRETLPMDNLAKLYIDEVVSRHGVPLSIVSDHDSRWDSHLPLVEFAYNNNYHSSIGMAPFEALYGWKCRTPVCCLVAGEKQFTGSKIVQETTDKVKSIRERLKAAQYRQKSYADKKKRPMEFQVGDRVMLKVSPWKGIIRFGEQEVESPFPWTIHVDKGNRCVEEPDAILEKKSKKLRHKEVTMVKVQWKHHHGANVTWEAEDDMKRRYPHLYGHQVNLWFGCHPNNNIQADESRTKRRHEWTCGKEIIDSGNRCMVRALCSPTLTGDVNGSPTWMSLIVVIVDQIEERVDSKGRNELLEKEVDFQRREDWELKSSEKIYTNRGSGKIGVDKGKGSA
ncbi:hypothetical protein L6452_35934 [Arctium lappa]|uniref:Uncharacterized protein n=1 Tax=Arctium lappa TaxID=4217 RepID=A0ACB8Y7S9_ARCLA|nr:hypothetical protein L6452_35934 [Arctium lappa]